MNHFVYIKDMLAVETNLDKFYWSFGANAPKVHKDLFDKCKIKVYLNVVRDKDVPKNDCERFSFFTTNRDKTSLYYNRNIFGGIRMSFNLRIDGNSVYMTCGKNYYNFVRLRIMNIHSAGYLLSDVVEGLLLKNGLCTLYCSSINFEEQERSACIFGAPNTGKTLTAMLLCNRYGGKLMSEDFAVTDGEYVYGAPWTNTHRKYNIEGGSDRVEIEENPCRITDIVVLQKGEDKEDREKNLEKVRYLNRYGLCYVKSPCLIALSYFNKAFDLQTMMDKENEILEKLTENCNYLYISSENATNFADVYACCLK